MARERGFQKLVGKLVRLAEEGGLADFEAGIRGNPAQEFLTMSRSAKLLVRGDRPFREAAARILADVATACLDRWGAEEFGR